MTSFTYRLLTPTPGERRMAAMLAPPLIMSVRVAVAPAPFDPMTAAGVLAFACAGLMLVALAFALGTSRVIAARLRKPHVGWSR